MEKVAGGRKDKKSEREKIHAEARIIDTSSTIFPLPKNTLSLYLLLQNFYKFFSRWLYHIQAECFDFKVGGYIMLQRGIAI